MSKVSFSKPTATGPSSEEKEEVKQAEAVDAEATKILEETGDRAVATREVTDVGFADEDSIGLDEIVLPRIMTGVDQAFEQSPYLRIP